MLNSSPLTIEQIMAFSWEDIKPRYHELAIREIGELTIGEWLRDWSKLIDLVFERYARLNVALSIDTSSEPAEKQFNQFLEEIHSPSQSANQILKEKLLSSGFQPDGLNIPIKKMRAEAEIFSEKNLPLLVEDRKFASEYNKIIGKQSVQLKGKEYTTQQLRPIMQSSNRSQKERIWRSASERQLKDRQQINELWEKQIQLRIKLAENAALPDYRAYRWKQLTRLDYTPEDCLKFHDAIEQVVVPAATRVYEKYREQIQVERLRPWDLDLDLYPIVSRPGSTYGTTNDLISKTAGIFNNLDKRLGDYFSILWSENLLDLENIKGKAPGAYCINFPITQRPFIFMNAVGVATDVRTLIHESGHAFHNFERNTLPYAQQRMPGLEFAEVASMSMELLTLPYINQKQGGIFNDREAKAYTIEQLERILIFWPYMAVVDAFQHWVYTHPQAGDNPACCDAKWYELWLRFIPGVDWSGLEAEAMTGWHRKQHIHRAPFYYVEYGLAQLGAVQVWQKSLINQKNAIERYLKALSLGGIASLPDLFKTAGAKFAFNASTLKKAVRLIEQKIQELEEN